jgi:hypothetical protein
MILLTLRAWRERYLDAPDPAPAPRPLSLRKRRRIIRALVLAQDRIPDVDWARAAMAAWWGTTVGQVREIEEQGLRED